MLSPTPNIHIMSDTAKQSADQSSSSHPVSRRLVTTWRCYDSRIMRMMQCDTSVSAVTRGVTSTEKLGEDYGRFSFHGKLYTALKPAHKDKSWRRLMWPRPIFVLHSRSAPISQRMILPLFLILSLSPLSVWVYATASSPPIMPLLSFPTHTPFALCSFFIHSYFTASTAKDTSLRRAGALPHYNLSLCFYLHSSSFPSSGDFTFISSSFTLLSSLSQCVGAFLSLPFFPPCSCAPHCSPFSSSPIRSLQFLYFSPSLSLVSFCFPPQSLVMRCDKPLPCYHSNRVPVATQRRWWWGVRWPQFSANTFNFLPLPLTRSQRVQDNNIVAHKRHSARGLFHII